MKIYPAIDLLDGDCVRLEQGRFDSNKVYNKNPTIVACDYAAAGANYLHVIDLDGAKSKKPQQTGLIVTIAQKSGLKVQTGGGIRTRGQVKTLLDGGIDRVIIGSLAVKQRHMVQSFLQEFGGAHLTLAFDVRLNAEGIPMLATEGWIANEDTSLWDILDFYSGDDLKSILCTDIGRDGMLAGPNLALYRDIVGSYPNLEVQASGGVAEVSDLKDIKNIGCGAVIIGKALYERRFAIGDALNVG